MNTGMNLLPYKIILTNNFQRSSNGVFKETPDTVFKKVAHDVFKKASHDVLTKKVFLVQTDTTVGFLSQDEIQLAQIKEREFHKPFVQVTHSFKMLKKLVRIPTAHKRSVRRARSTTFAYTNNKAVRVVKDEKHAAFIKPFGWFYSTSANEKSLSYDQEFAFSKSDIIVQDDKGLYEGASSKIYRLYKTKKKRLR